MRRFLLARSGGRAVSDQPNASILGKVPTCYSPSIRTPFDAIGWGQGISSCLPLAQSTSVSVASLLRSS